MDGQYGRSCSSTSSQSEEEMDLRRGPWTVEEDLTLVNYIASHGEGRWNALARCAGLKRTGKSCRLRWLNYLRPDVRRGNITPEEQLLILELHSRWGNRWSKIAQHLPGRTDNEIKNYWRTRVQKQAKQLRCDVNSKQFKDTMRCLWMPRLVERIRAANGQTSAFPAEAAQPLSPPAVQSNHVSTAAAAAVSYTPDSSFLGHAPTSESLPDCYFENQDRGFYSSSYCGAGDGLFNTKPDVEPITSCPDAPLISPHGCYYQYYQFQGDQAAGGGRLTEKSNAGGADISGGSSWDVDDGDDVMWYWRQQLGDDGLLL